MLTTILLQATAERFIYSMRAPRNKEHHIVKAKLIVPLPYMILPVCSVMYCHIFVCSVWQHREEYWDL